MRHLALVMGTAAVVVAVWVLLSKDHGLTATPLPEVRDGSSPSTVSGGDDPMSPGPTSRGGVRVPGEGPPRPVPTVGLEGLCQKHGAVGSAVYEIVRKSVGQDARTLDRRFAREDIHEILTAWHTDPSRKDADIDFLVRAWNMVEDPTARYALSWLFRHARDDRVIGPLTELAAHHPWPAVDAIADQRTELAAVTLVDLKRHLGDEPTRNQATIRIARSGWAGATEHLKDVWTDDRRSDLERLVAVESLAHVSNDPESRLSAFELAVGDARPLSGIGRRATDHPTQDLRSAAVMAVMHSGDQNLARKLLAEAEARQPGDSFVAMVDLHVGTFQGADISRLVLDRVNRRRRVTLGEARYLNRVCTSEDVDRLRQLARWAADAAAQEMIQAAILNAASRG